MTKTEAEKIMKSWGSERCGYSRVRNGMVVEVVQMPKSPARNGGFIANPKRRTGWRLYKF